MLLLTVPACAPDVGSEKWCTNMKETPGNEWTIKQAKEYAKYCVFKVES